jgi:hypothetical protein
MAQINSQAFQDKFAFDVIGAKGTYVEIGAHKPAKNSNTYMLEVDYGWQGIGIELNQTYQRFWDKHPERKNKIYWESALDFDYVNALKENNLPLHINYLSCDIEPPFNTFLALRRVIEQGITFDCITFEHDLYNYNKENYNEIATNYLLEKGYKVAVSNVYYRAPENHFETWFVNNNIEFTPVDFKDWKQQ